LLRAALHSRVYCRVGQVQSLLVGYSFDVVAGPDFAIPHYTGGGARGDMSFLGWGRGGGSPNKCPQRERFPIRSDDIRFVPGERVGGPHRVARRFTIKSIGFRSGAIQ
jgi:hypothetical protein